MSSETKLPYAYSKTIRSDREQKSNKKYVGTVPTMNSILNRFLSAVRAQSILRYILLVTVFLGMSCIIICVHYTSRLNRISIILPHVIDLRRLTWSNNSPKPIENDDGHKTIIDKSVTKYSNQCLKYRFTTIAGVNKSISRYTKTLYPLTLDAPYVLSNPYLCKSVANLSALLIVHTAPDHFERRDIIRKTWTNNTYFHFLGSIRTVFLLGTLHDNATQRKIEDEFKKHEDLVQGNFIDAYRNLTHKGVMGYKWISENCMNVQMVVKTDDDVVVDTYKLLGEYILKLAGRKRYILCNHIATGTMPIIREKKNKWYVDSDLFRGHTFYPRYCSGFSVIISTDIIPFLYRAAYLTPFFWVDDVYLYGMLPSKVKNIAYISLAGNFSLNFKTALECFENNTKQCPFLISGGSKPEEVVKVWNAMGKAYDKTVKINLKSSNTSTENGEANKDSDKSLGKIDLDKNQMPNQAAVQTREEQDKAAITNGAEMPANKTKEATIRANTTTRFQKDSGIKENTNENQSTTDAKRNKLGNLKNGYEAGSA